MRKDARWCRPSRAQKCNRVSRGKGSIGEIIINVVNVKKKLHMKDMSGQIRQFVIVKSNKTKLLLHQCADKSVVCRVDSK